MGIIFKYALKSILEKKARTFLIIISIIISSAVFFASNAISDTVMSMFKDSILGFYGTSHIVVESAQDSTNRYFHTREAASFNDYFDTILSEMPASAAYQINKSQKANFILRGIDNIDNLNRISPIKIIRQKNLYPFEGRKIIINVNTSNKYNLNIGDSINLSFKDKKQKFLICAITESSGPMSSMGSGNFAIAPIDSIWSINDTRGKVSSMYIKLKDPSQKQKLIKELSNVYKHNSVREPFSEAELKQMTSEISMTFMLMSIVVFFMSIFIIYTSFKVIVAERLPIIGTIRSVGATKRMTNFFLLSESLLYGLLGGIGGSLMGVGVLYVFTVLLQNMISSQNPGFQPRMTVTFSPTHFIASLIMAVVLCFVSSIFPIIKISRMPIKDVVLNSLQKPVKKKALRLIFGIISLVAIALICMRPGGSDDDTFAAVAMLLCPISIVLLIPYITSGFILVFERIYSYILGNEGILAAKNLRENQSIINNITLLAIGISSLVMINTASFSASSDILKKYTSVYYDLQISGSLQDKNYINVLSNTRGVENIYSLYQSYTEEINGIRSPMQIFNADISKYLYFWKLDSVKNAPNTLKELDSGRNIILTKALSQRLHINKGDIMSIKTPKGVKVYKVLECCNTIMGYNYTSIISERFLKADFGPVYVSTIYIKTNRNTDEVKQSIIDVSKSKQTGYDGIRVETKNESEKTELQNIEQSAMLLRLFSILAMIIGSFGVINNLLISFIERRQSMALLRSIGMEKRQIIKMVFIESATGGIIGSTIGIIGGFIMILVLAGASESSTISFPFDSLVYYIASGCLIMLISSISPAVKSARINILSAIKYE